MLTHTVEHPSIFVCGITHLWCIALKGKQAIIWPLATLQDEKVHKVLQQTSGTAGGICVVVNNNCLSMVDAVHLQTGLLLQTGLTLHWRRREEGEVSSLHQDGTRASVTQRDIRQRLRHPGLVPHNTHHMHRVEPAATSAQLPELPGVLADIRGCST